MFLLMGWDKTAERLGTVCQHFCCECRGHVGWEVARTNGWLRLLSLPVFPLRTEHVIFCSQCGDGFKLARCDFKAIDSHMQTAGTIEQTNIQRLLFDSIGETQLTGKSEIQLAWIESSRAQATAEVSARNNVSDKHT